MRTCVGVPAGTDQVNQFKQNISARIDEMMTRQVPAGGFPAGGPRH